MFTETEMDELRQDQLATMVDTFVAFTTETVRTNGWDSDELVEQYETPGKVGGRSERGATSDPKTVSIGGVEYDEVEGGLKIPVDKPVPAEGWLFTCTAVHPTSDPALLNRWWHVIGVPTRSQPTKRRLDVVEVPDPTDPS